MRRHLRDQSVRARHGNHVARVLQSAILLSASFLAAPFLAAPSAATAAVSQPAAQKFTQPCGNPGTPGQVHHVVWIWMENESYSSVIGNANAPYQNELAHQCGTAANSHNESHASLDNYIAATSGQNILNTSFTNDCSPSPHANNCVTSSQSIFSQTDAAGDSWRGYNEDMPSNCDQTNSGNYAVRHNPAAYYTTLSTCGQYDIPMGSAATRTGAFYDDVRNGSLPSFSFVTPNLIDDAHNSSTAVGDSWLSGIVPLIINGPNYQNGDTAIFITNDEGCGGSCGPDYAVNENCASQALDAAQPSCHIPTIVVAPYTPAGITDSAFYTHYSMLRTTEELLGLPLLGLAATANSMTSNFNLGPASNNFAPPAAPMSLRATVADPSEVDLSWTASAPGSAPVTGYQVMRGGVTIATTASTAYSDTAASPGTTYSYTVSAVDAVGNVSPASNTATVTTPTVTNLLGNPGFETWSSGLPVGWASYGPSTTLTQSSDTHSGSSSVSIATTSSGYAASGVKDGAKPTISSTTAGTAYAASCWVKATKAITINLQLHEEKQNGTSVDPAAITSLAVPTTTSWYQLQLSYTTTGTGNMVPMVIYSTNTKGGGATFEVDDCTLTSSFS